MLGNSENAASGEPAQANDGSDAVLEQSFYLLMRIWACAVLFSQFSSLYWAAALTTAGGAFEALAAASAAIVLLFRITPVRLLLAIFLETLNLCYRLPELPNHCHVLLFINFLLSIPVLRWLRGWLTAKENTGTPAGLGAARYFWSNTVPFLQALTIVVYFYAVLAKLNWTYLDQSFSCSVAFFDNIASYLTFLPRNRVMYLFVIYGSVGVETALPLFLLIPRLRTRGILLGLLFHYVLAFDLIKYFTNFSGVMFFLLLCYCSPAFFIQLRRSFLLCGPATAESRWTIRDRAASCVAMLLIAAIVIPGAYSEFVPPVEADRLWQMCAMHRHLVWLIYSTGILSIFSWTMIRSLRNPQLSPTAVAPQPLRTGLQQPRPLPVFEWVLMLPILLNGASPYLGLKTRTSYNMYSNLRIEPGISNHLVFPGSLDLLGFMSEAATIRPDQMLDIRKDVCNHALLIGSPYPLVEIARRATECPNENIVFTFENTTYHSQSPPGQRLLAEHSSALSRRFTIFRPLDEHAATDCVW